MEVAYALQPFALPWLDTVTTVVTDLGSEEAYIEGPGFPSWHVQSAATFWGYAAVLAGRAWSWLVAVLVIALVGQALWLVPSGDPASGRMRTAPPRGLGRA
jgi:membrane-associated phospholipid phosphatase